MLPVRTKQGAVMVSAGSLKILETQPNFVNEFLCTTLVELKVEQTLAISRFYQ
jgi:hypothetical protein